MITIIDKIRSLVGDLIDTTGRQVFQFLSVSSSKIFTLQESNVIENSIKVYKNGIEWSDDNWTYNPLTIQVVVDEETGEELEVGDSILVTFSFYKKYSDTEIIGNIKGAVSYLAVYKYKTFSHKSDNIIYPTPNETEENLIAIVASILMKGDIRQYRTPELTIIFNDNEPKEKRIMNVVRKFKKTYGEMEYIDLGKNFVEETEE